MTEKTVLVTGARGFFGGYVVEHYLAAGWRVVGLGHGNPGSACEGHVVWHHAPVCLERLERLEMEPDLLVHCAGGGSVSVSLRDPFGDHARTVDTTAAVLEYVRRHCPRTPVVYPSSAAVYGNAAHLPASEGSTARLRPASPYGMHKLMAEQLCASYGAHFGVSVAVVRFFRSMARGSASNCCGMHAARSASATTSIAARARRAAIGCMPRMRRAWWPWWQRRPRRRARSTTVPAAPPPRSGTC
ncbi:hypothetical protein OJJOAM_003673 [Cupriavidus sp. H18C1]